MISGGNLYNAGLLAALEAVAAVRAVAVGEWKNAPQVPGIYLVDSLDLAEIDVVRGQREEGQYFVLLVHHLPSLEPGLPAADPALALEARTLEAFDAFVATSTFTADYLRARGHHQPIVTIEPVVSCGVAEQPTRALPICALMSCNLIARKGVLEFLEALDRGVRAEDQFQIDIVGRRDLDPDYSADCASLLGSSSLLSERVTLRGESPSEDMAGWYGSANLFLSAAKMETFGISLQEARQFALPIFAVRGGNAENHICEGENGELFASPGEMVDGFLRLVRSADRVEAYWQCAYSQRPSPVRSWQLAAQDFIHKLDTWFPC